ncbi:MAG: HAD family hydrolase [Acidimicrobiales bacterium]
MTTAVAVWDLDGTTCRGDEPYRHYASLIARAMTAKERSGYLAALERFLGGGYGVHAADGWQAVVVLAGRFQGGRQDFSEAFAATRRHMIDGACSVDVPEGLVDLIGQHGNDTRHVLVSNTAARWVMPLLARLDLDCLFDEIVCAAAKPCRFATRLEALARVSGVPVSSVLSVGDHFPNDIEPGVAAGCATAYIDPYGVGPAGRATFEASRIEDLLPAIGSWLADRSENARL